MVTMQPPTKLAHSMSLCLSVLMHFLYMFWMELPISPSESSIPFSTSGRFTLLDHVATDLTPQSPDWPRSKSL